MVLAELAQGDYSRSSSPTDRHRSPSLRGFLDVTPPAAAAAAAACPRGREMNQHHEGVRRMSAKFAKRFFDKYL